VAIVRRLWAMTCCALVLLASCAQDEEPALQTPPAQTANPDIKPTVSINFPEKGKDVPAGDVIVAITVTSFDVVDKLGQPPTDGEGHVHFYLDVEDLPTEPGKPAVTDDATTYHAGPTTSHTWKDVPAGKHRFAVQLVNNNHTPLEPPVTDEITVTVEENG
jgi:hypothetical protein